MSVYKREAGGDVTVEAEDRVMPLQEGEHESRNRRQYLEAGNGLFSKATEGIMSP